MNLSTPVRKGIVSLLEQKVKDGDYFTECYEKVQAERIGKGAFGEVYHMRHMETKHEYAVKVIQLKYDERYSDDSVTTLSNTDTTRIFSFVQSCQEAILQSQVFNHENIVKISDAWLQSSIDSGGEKQRHADSILTIVEFLSQPDKGENDANTLSLTADVRTALMETEGLMLYLVMEKYDMDLKEWLTTDQTLEMKQKVVNDVVLALHYLHSKKHYCHLDLKPSNILVQRSISTIKASLTDFGLSILDEVPSTPITQDYRPGTSPYNSAPDAYISYQYDMWSFGIICYQVATQSVLGHELGELVKRAKECLLEQFITDKTTSCGHLVEFSSTVVRCLRDHSDRVSSADLYKEYHSDYLPVTMLTFDSDSEGSTDDTANRPSYTKLLSTPSVPSFIEDSDGEDDNDIVFE